MNGPWHSRLSRVAPTGPVQMRRLSLTFSTMMFVPPQAELQPMKRR